MRINEKYDLMRVVRIVHQINHFSVLLRRNRMTFEQGMPQSYVTANCLPNELFNLRPEDI
jgi:hypothetical protein